MKNIQIICGIQISPVVARLHSALGKSCNEAGNRVARTLWLSDNVFQPSNHATCTSLIHPACMGHTILIQTWATFSYKINVGDDFG